MFEKKIVVGADLGVDRVRCRYPVDRGFHFASIGRIAAAGCGIICAVNFNHLAVPVLNDVCTGNEIAITQSHFTSWRQTIKLLWRILAEVVAFNIQNARERDFPRARAGVFRIIDRVHLLDLAFWIIVDYEFQRTQHGHYARHTFVEILAEEMLEHRQLDGAIRL